MNVRAGIVWKGLFWMSVTLAVGLATATRSSAQAYRNLSSVQDGSGLMSTNTVNIGGVNYRHVSAAGQPGGIFTNANGALNNNPGFLQAVDIKHPTQVDKYGNPFELTPDNDADGLSDTAEVTGSGFNPTTATDPNVEDSDADGYADGAEAAAGTDPNDTNANLRILSIRTVSGQREITYLARSAKNYTIHNSDGGYNYPTNSLGTDMEVGGSGSWEVRTNTYSDASTQTGRFYAVEPQVP